MVQNPIEFVVINGGLAPLLIFSLQQRANRLGQRAFRFGRAADAKEMVITSALVNRLVCRVEAFALSAARLSNRIE
jgi:hypothetical protein